MELENLVGETLDEKYRIEKELGRGGMGAVYLATHLGTERPVALKVIVPQFMQRAEFIERFRREARAAGRLRHPNVVDVTDFGFADVKTGRVAYLVMEYLDGCTLGEILEEEKRLPLSWTLDILEQVSSAVDEAHQQGIVHRDLKPDNIWLEPNQRGGYTVKVLDFGIAKLENHPAENSHTEIAANSDSPASSDARRTQAIVHKTNPGDEGATQLIDTEQAAPAEKRTAIIQPPSSKTLAAEAGTLIQPLAEISSENETAILSPTAAESEAAGTKLLTSDPEATAKIDAPETASLTRVGAVLGTPLYMSPEQCRGEQLDARSDIYSLAVIAYQMLAGKTPFGGNFTEVMEAHKNAPPPPLEGKKIPRKIKKVIGAAMAKNAADRPPSAEAFSSELRAYSEGIGALLRRSLTIYGEHLPKFLKLTILLYVPLILATLARMIVIFLRADEAIGETPYKVFNGLLYLLTTFAGMFSGYLVFGTITWLVCQILAIPLRPVHLKPALDAARKKWKSLIGTGIAAATLTLVGYGLCIIPGFFLSVYWALVAPVLIMENLRGRAALKRSKQLVKRSVWTTTAAILIMFFVPFTLASLTSLFVATTIKSFSDTKAEINAAQQAAKNENRAMATNQTDDGITTAQKATEQKEGFNINFGTDDEKPKIGGINGIVHEMTTTILILPLQILIASFSSIIVALLYLKTRQAGGESMQDLLAQFEESDQPRRKWQKRIRERLEQSGRTVSRASTTGRQSHG